MAFKDIAKKIKYPQGTSARFKRLDALDRLREGEFYDHITTPFDQETNGTTYIRMRERRPSIIWNGAQMLTDQLSGLLWGDEQTPIVRTYFGEEPAEGDRQAEESIQHLIEQLDLDEIMDQVTDKASSGSCCVVVRAVGDDDDEDGLPYIEVIPGKECRPTFNVKNPLKLELVEQIYPTNGLVLYERGYDIPEDDRKEDQAYWFRLVIDATDETWYVPMRDDKYQDMMSKKKDPKSGKPPSWTVDADNSGPHGWPCIPAIWIKSPKGKNQIDGRCLYQSIVDMIVGIDYELSQIDRGIRYTADPMLMIRRGELRSDATPSSYDDEDPSNQPDNGIQTDAEGAHTITVDPRGDAKFVEITGKGIDKASEFTKLLREWGLEICGGMKADAENQKGAQSGRALEILYQTLVLLVKRWRVALGNRGFLPLIRLLLIGIEANLFKVQGVEKADPKTTKRLIWPTWMTPSGTDLLAMAQALVWLGGGGTPNGVAILPRSFLTKLGAANLGATDADALLDELEQQADDDAEDAAAQADDEHTKQLELATAAPAEPGGGSPGGKKPAGNRRQSRRKKQ